MTSYCYLLNIQFPEWRGFQTRSTIRKRRGRSLLPAMNTQKHGVERGSAYTKISASNIHDGGKSTAAGAITIISTAATAARRDCLQVQQPAAKVTPHQQPSINTTRQTPRWPHGANPQYFRPYRVSGQLLNTVSSSPPPA